MNEASKIKEHTVMVCKIKEQLEDIILDLAGRHDLSKEEVKTFYDIQEELERRNS